MPPEFQAKIAVSREENSIRLDNNESDNDDDISDDEKHHN